MMQYQQPPYYGQQMPTAWNPPVQQAQQNGFYWVNDRPEVDRTKLANGTSAVFLSVNENVFWFKTVDSAGNARVKTCDYTERKEAGSEEYATKKDIEDIKTMFELIMEGKKDG